MTNFQQPTLFPQRGRSDRGIAAIVLLYGMSVFSVLSLTVLRNAELEKTFRTADDPDLHVVLYAGGADSPTTVGRLNLPTAYRNADGPDKSTEVRIPNAPHLDMAADLPAGWSYAVRLSAEARVCCDGGDNACASIAWDTDSFEGSLAPAIPRPIKPTVESRELQFALSSLPIPGDVMLNPAATASSAFLVRATRVRPGSSEAAPPVGQGAEAMSCTLQSGDTTLATGTLRIRPGVDENGAATRISAGTFELKYTGLAGSAKVPVVK